MNIGYFANFKYPPLAGGNVHAYQVASQLAKKGHSIYTIFYDREVPILSRYRRRHLLKFLKKIDVLYIRIDGSWKNEKFTLLKMLRPFSLPVIWEINAPLEELLTFGNDINKVRYLNFKRTLLAKLVDGAICVSEGLREYAFMLGIKNIYVIPNGSDKELFSPEKKDSDIYKRFSGCFKIIWAGSAKYKWHGINIIFEIARKTEFIDKKIIFILITNEKYLNDYSSNTKNIMVIDEKQYFELPPYLASADVGLCLYHNYGWNNKFYFSPLKLFDYMASGLPVIATDIGQISEIIKNKRNGILVNDNNIEEVIENILFLKNNPNIAEKIGKEARYCIENYYNWERVANETEKVLDSLI